MSEVEPIIGLGSFGPTVVYQRSGLSARRIEVAQPASFYLTNIVYLANRQVSLSLRGGLPNTPYDIFRAPAITTPFSAMTWTLVGTIRLNEEWIDTNPPIPAAVYVAAEPTP